MNTLQTLQSAPETHIKTVTPLDLIAAYDDSMYLRKQIRDEIGWINNINTHNKAVALRCKYWTILSDRTSLRLRSYCDRLLRGDTLTRKEINSLRISAANRFGKGTVLVSPDTGAKI